MNRTATPVEELHRIDEDAWLVAEQTYESLLGILRVLPIEDWDAPTDCAGWTVADMVGHIIGAAKSNASLRAMLRQQFYGLRHKDEFDGNSLDALNDLQVRDHAALTPDERIATLEELAPRAIAGRRRTPRLLHAVPLPVDATGSMDDWGELRLTLGQLQKVTYTRDAWLHRLDIARPLGLPMPHDPQLDRTVVEDAVADWASTHRQPFRLELTGAVEGIYVQGDGGPTYRLDAFEWCRAVTRRTSCDGLLRVPVIF